ncbi:MULTISPECIES: MSC_0882 family membrane protein [unclassified Mycoplasma]|uniref:MSC_0882 family membrane protein n=1 Tax=unclassified Mycoplasma TaxID=2683645 RepID=UPI00211B7EBF|nr:MULTISPECIES: hypothetical protein [unclassified Mycoplasma]UUM19773.1 hypothetical protein NPA11_03325 [Mycoplasma sp. 1578d]UUM24756.1 hypothetical protein NPA12_03615 [Mycoplasma sp. 3686d]
MFRPKTSNDTVELQPTNQLEKSIQEQEKVINKYQDPNKQLSPATYRIIHKEKTILKFGIAFWVLILLATITAGLCNYFLNTAKNPNSGILNWIIIVIVFLTTFYLLVKNLIRLSAFKNVERRYRESFSNGDIAASTLFADLYKSISLKLISYTWLYVFFMTFFALFVLIIYLLYNVGEWELKTSENSAIKFELHLNFQEIFKGWFGNTIAFLWVSLFVIISVTLLYIFILLYNKKRIADVKILIVYEAAQFITAVDQSKKSLNKAWRNTYIIIFILVYVLPFALMLFLIYRGVLRRKK